jgi:hypothetical protein
MALEQVHAKAVALTQRPHPPGGEERGHDGERQACEADHHRKVDRDGIEVGEHERDPHERGVVLEEPVGVRAQLVLALPADDP